MERVKYSNLYRILALIFALIGALGIFPAPSTADPIKALDESAVKVSFAAWADSHVGTYMLGRKPAFKNAVTDLANATTSPDAVIVAGDITENGLAEEYAFFYQDLSICNNVENYLIAVGNHDIRIRSYKQSAGRFKDFYNEFTGENIDNLYYSSVINGYYFIVLGSDEECFEEAIISDKQLAWLDETLAEGTATGLPVFVTVHQPINQTHGLPNSWGTFANPELGGIGKQSNELRAILQKYEGVFLITGHVHSGIGEHTYEMVEGIHSINLPPLTKKGANGYANEKGEGFMVEVYEEKVVFRARNFVEGRYIPDYDIEIEL